MLASRASYGTLDDVPEFALQSPETLYAMLFSQFQNHEGALVYGQQHGEYAHGGYWGRRMQLPSQETLQLRFHPRELSRALHEGIALIATRISNGASRAQVAVVILFKASNLTNGGTHEWDVSSQSRVCACKGLHLLMIGIYKRHNPTIGKDRIAVSGTNACYDPSGYQAVRSTTYSVHEKGWKFTRAPPHTNACAATAGPSVVAIAAELVNMHLEPCTSRVAEPISRAHWKEVASAARSAILAEYGTDKGTQAFAVAATIVELLSAEGIVGFRANSFFDGALPDRFLAPNGLALPIALAVRLAIYWEAHGLPRPSEADLAANDRVRMICNSGSYGALPLLKGNWWSIDVILHGAISGCEAEIDEMKARRHMPPLSEINVVMDNKVFWQRLGQRLITSIFGLGSGAHTGPTENKFGVPWRMHDPLQLAGDKHLLAEGVRPEGMDAPALTFASIAERRTSLIELLMDVEKWLRDGTQRGLHAANPKSDTSELSIQRVKNVLGALMFSTITDDLTARAVKAQAGEAQTSNYEDVIAKQMAGNFCLEAMDAAIEDAKGYLMHGPMMHFKYGCGAYVVGATQTAPCTDCEQPVHVLHGAMLCNAYSKCTACNAKRCFECTAVYARALRVTESQRVGKRCRRCGAEPAMVTVCRSTSPDADSEHLETFSITIGERVSTVTLGELSPEETTSTVRGGSANNTSSPSTPAGARGKKTTRARR